MERNEGNSIALRMSIIRMFLYESLNEIFEGEGFKFKKSNFSFKRKRGKNYEVFYFLFFDYFPLNYQVRILLEVWNDDIEKVKIALPYEQNIENFNFRSVSVPMGVFINEQEIRRQIKKYDTGYMLDETTGDFIKKDHTNTPLELTCAQIQGYSYELATDKDLLNVSTAMTALLQMHILPLANKLSTTGGIDDFFASRPGWSVNSLSLNNFVSELIAAKLSGQRSVEEVYMQIQFEIDKKNLLGGKSQETKRVIEEIYKYLHTI
jgi:hypothetical protein